MKISFAMNRLTNGNFEPLAKYLGFGCSEFTSQESGIEYPTPEKKCIYLWTRPAYNKRQLSGQD
jgi:hypothetical protein